MQISIVKNYKNKTTEFYIFLTYSFSPCILFSNLTTGYICRKLIQNKKKLTQRFQYTVSKFEVQRGWRKIKASFDFESLVLHFLVKILKIGNNKTINKMNKIYPNMSRLTLLTISRGYIHCSLWFHFCNFVYIQMTSFFHMLSWSSLLSSSSSEWGTKIKFT